MIVQDPGMVEDLFVKQNKLYEKTHLNAIVYQDLMRETFTFAKGDKGWNSKRQVVQHAFYQSRAENMVFSLQGQISDTVKSWKAKIDDERKRGSDSPNFTFDCVAEFERIFAQNIITILFGEDLAEARIKIKFRVSDTGS